MTKKGFNLKNMIAIAICLAGVTMFIGCSKENSDSQIVTDDNSKSIRLLNPIDRLNEIKTSCKHKKISFTPSEDVPASIFSHTQGYARYRGDGYDYHIFTYSNVSDYPGYVYIVGGTKTYTLEVPKTEIRFNDVSDHHSSLNPHFNHTCGIQILGNCLAVPVIPVQQNVFPDFYDAAIIYFYDLTSLTDSIPSAPSGKEILRVPKVNGGSLSGVGIIDLPNGYYALGLMTDNNLDIYLSSTKMLWSATWYKHTTYKLKASSGSNHYQGIGLFIGEDNEVYVLGGDNRGSKDWADLYKLTEKSQWKTNGELKSIKEIHLYADNASFSNACAIEIRNQNELIIYSADTYYSGGGININWWDKN